MKVAVLGMGIIGEIWAEHLCADGLLSATWNRTPKTNAKLAVDSPHAAALKANVLIVVVADPPAVESTVNNMLPGLGPDHLIIQSSTIGPGDSERFQAAVESTGARYLEAPFTGSKPAASERKLVYYLGGALEQVHEAEPVLERLSAKRIHIGTGPQACSIKLAMNLQIATLIEALCEALHTTRAGGVPDDIFFDCMRGNASWSPLAAMKEPKLREQDYSPQFSVKHLLKDLRLLKVAKGTMPALDTMIEQLSLCEKDGAADLDFSALYEQRTK